MARFSVSEMVEFRAIRALCYAELPPVDLLRQVSTRIRRAVGADAYCSSQLDPATALLTNAVSEGWPIEAKALLLDHVFFASAAADPSALLAAGRRVVDIDELLGDLDRPLDDPYFQYHLLPFGYRRELQVVCSIKGAAQAFLTLTWKDGGEPSDAGHVRLLDALAPHVAAGLARAGVRAALASRRESDVGLLILDDSGRIELANGVAESWLSADARRFWPLGLPLYAGLLARRAWGESTDACPIAELPHPETAALYRLHCDHRFGTDGRSRTVILLEPVHPASQPAALSRMGLSPREAEVTIALVRGLAVKEIAANLRCSYHTVAQHSKSVFLKLGVSSRGELAALLLGPPSPGPADGIADQHALP